MLATQFVSLGLFAATAPAGNAVQAPVVAASASAPESHADGTVRTAAGAPAEAEAASAGAGQAPPTGTPPQPALQPTEPTDAAASPAGAGATSPDPVIAAPGSRDPLQGFNRVSYRISQPIDHFLIRPLAMTYKHVVPEPIRDGAHNAISNINEPVVFINDVLQFRPKRALHTVLRFLVNSTLGLGGLFDMAKRKPFHLRHHENGFADTLGYYGIPAGPYLYLPVLGPSNPRDLIGAAGDLFAQPRLWSKIIHPDSDKSIFRNTVHMGMYSTVIFIVDGLDQRVRNDAELEAFKSQSVDPYAALRSSYMQDREAEIGALKAKEGAPVAVPAFDQPLEDPAAMPSTGTATPPPPAAPAAPAAYTNTR